MSSEEWYTIVFDVPAPMAHTIFELMTGQCRHFKFYPAKDQTVPGVQPKPAPVEPERETWIDAAGHKRKTFVRTENTGRWAEKFWKEMAPIFANGPVRFDDPRLAEILVQSGHSPKSVSAVLHELTRRGYVEHANRRGEWQKTRK